MDETLDPTRNTRPGMKRREPKRRPTSDQRLDPEAARDDELDPIEILAAVCGDIAEGFTIRQILARMETKYPKVKLTREDPYALMRKAAKRGWFSFHPPQHWHWTKMLEDDYYWLKDVRVVHTPTPEHVMQEGAESLLRLLKRYLRKHGRREVHIGFSGGHAMRSLARWFAKLLSESTDSLPDKVVIHAMAAGFDPRDPTTDPNTFCSYFSAVPMNEIKVEFLGLAAPSLVKPADIRALRDLPDIRDAFAAVREIDIIVASGSDWLDPHSALRNLMLRSPESARVLEAEGCIADILWRPLSERGPIEKETCIRALTLVELSELPGLIEQGKHVLLTLAPCGLCNEPKGRLLSCLLGQPKPLFTDLVVDTRTVAHMLRLKPEQPGH